jgi:ferredoxin-NADP reductase
MVHGHDEYHELVIAQVIEETADSRSFILEIPTELAETFVYRAGQFCTFEATIGGEQVVRSYSMASSPEVGEQFKTTVKRVPNGAMSNWMIDELERGDVLKVLRPAGLFVLRDADTPIVAFAGGSGITPVISIIKTALATTERPISLIYANRDKDSIIFADELESLVGGSGGRLQVHHHLDEVKGFLDAEACVSLIGDLGAADFYVCGPGAFMDTVEAALEKIGIRQDQLFIERFALPGETPEITEASATETVTIKLDRKKASVDYRMGDTILDTARRGGMRPPYSCEAGNCATCMAMLEKGTVTMRANNALTPAELEEGWVLTCQSVPTSAEIVINYDA